MFASEVIPWAWILTPVYNLEKRNRSTDHSITHKYSEVTGVGERFVFLRTVSDPCFEKVRVSWFSSVRPCVLLSLCIWLRKFIILSNINTASQIPRQLIDDALYNNRLPVKCLPASWALFGYTCSVSFRFHGGRVSAIFQSRLLYVFLCNLLCVPWSIINIFMYKKVVLHTCSCWATILATL